jgi:hypothetical protein
LTDFLKVIVDEQRSCFGQCAVDKMPETDIHEDQQTTSSRQVCLSEPATDVPRPTDRELILALTIGQIITNFVIMGTSNKDTSHTIPGIYMICFS